MIEEENEREKDTVTKVKDKIKLDDYEETASEGIKIEADDPVEGKNGNETQKKEELSSAKESKQDKVSASKEPTKKEEVKV